MAGISQRISLEGSEDIRKKLQDLATAGEKAFSKLQAAGKKPIIDPSQIDKTKQAFNQLEQAVAKLSPQFQKLAGDTSAFGQAGARAGQQTASGLNQANQAIGETSAGFKAATGDANNLGVRIGVVSGLVSALTTKLLGMVGAFKEALSISNLLKGVQDSSKAISDQADKMNTNVRAWTELRRAITGAGASSEDFTKSVGTAGGILESARKELEAYVQANGKIKEAQDASKATISIYSGQTKELIEVMEHGGTIALPKLAAELRGFGVSLKSIQSKDQTEAWRELATIIGRIEDPAKRAAAGVKYFGDTWEKTIKILADIKGDLEKDPLKAGRELTEGQVKGANAAAAAWKDFDTAIRATKDQIGALFSAGSQMKAEWLTKLVDRSRELLKTWVGLSDVGRADFMKGIGDDATGTVFKTAIAFAQQLAGLWRDVLVPAGEKLMGIIGEIAGSFEGISKSQVAAFFITAAIAATGLAIALKGIGLLLTPLSLLAGLFSPLGAVLLAAGVAAMLFWEQISAGAKLAASLIPSELALINQAITKLFAGDFAGFWTDFSTAAVSAFKTISATFQQMISETIAQTPWAQALVDGIKQIAADAPGAIKLVAESLLALGEVAKTTANVINTMFGLTGEDKITGTGVAATVMLAQMTGALQALASVATTVAAAFTVVGVAFGILAAVIGGVPAAIIAVGAALVGAVAWWLRFSEAGQATVAAVNEFAARIVPTLNQIGSTIGTSVVAAFNAIVDAIGSVISKIGELASAIGGSIWDAFAAAGVAAMNAIGSAIDSMVAKMKGIGAAISGIFSGGGTPGSVTPAPGNARGGYIRGRGTGTSDSILSRLSNGEFVLSARAVRYWGVDFMRALNGLQMPGFSMGGLAGLAAPQLPRFAEGGLVGAMAHLGTVDLRTDHGSVSMMASSDAVEQLQRLAVQKRITATGRKPGFIS